MMKKYAFFLFLILMLSTVLKVSASEKVAYATYTYTYDGDSIASPHAYTPERVIRGVDIREKPLSKPSDLCVGADGRIFIADTGNNRVVVLDSNEALIASIEAFVYEGRNETFSKPKGVFATQDGNLYVADTDKARIVVFSPELKCIRILNAPESNVLPADFSFLPTRIAVDMAGRLYCICSGNIYGVVVLSQDGAFETFIGAQKVTPNLVERFWRVFMTKEQKRRTSKTVPSNYNSIAIDSKGFLYVTSSYSNTNAVIQTIKSRSTDNRYAMIKKLTPSGEDVLRRNGFFPPSGDVSIKLNTSGNEVNTDIHYGPSIITDVALGKNGIYSLMDQKRGKIFTYDANGNLLYAFGGTGYQPGLFQQLMAIDYSGSRLYALDGVSGNITRFELTAYGSLIQEAIALTEARQYEASVAVYHEILRENSNFDLANIGIGNAKIRQGDYKQAMAYYKRANMVSGYSKAFGLYRKDVFGNYILLVPVGIALLFFGVSAFLSWSRRYNLALANRSWEKRTIRQELMFEFHVMFHPFDSFWDLKRAKRGGVRGATILLAIVAGAIVMREIGTSYICTGKPINDSNVLLTLSVFCGVVLLWCVANWCLTSLMSGEGSFKDIYVSTGYALLPIALTMVPATILSHFVTEQETMFVSFLTSIGFIWSALLLFCAMMNTHAYTFGRSVLTVICTLVGMVFIAFLSLLFVNLIGRMMTFVSNVYREVAFRT